MAELTKPTKPQSFIAFFIKDMKIKQLNTSKRKFLIGEHSKM